MAMPWKYDFEVRDGRGRMHRPSGVVPYEGPPGEVFDYAFRTMFQSLQAEGPACPGPFKILDMHFERIE
jgi:hypothetical protein